MKLINHPRKIQIDQYDFVFNKIKNFCFNKINGIKYVIKYGSVKHPGISDLDILLVFDHISFFDFIRLRIFISKQSSNLVLHFPVILKSDTYKNIFELFPFFEYVEYSSKNNFKIKKQVISKVKSRIFIGQVLVTKFPKVINNFKSTSEVNVREFLLELSSFKHTISLLNILVPDTVNNKDLNDFLLYTSKIRDIALERNLLVEEIQKYLDLSTKAFYVLIDSTTDKEKKNETPLSFNSTLGYFNLSNESKNYINSQLNMFLPSWFFEDLKKMTNCNNFFGKKLSKHLSDIEIQEPGIDLIKYTNVVSLYLVNSSFYNPPVSFLHLGTFDSKTVSLIKYLKKIICK